MEITYNTQIIILKRAPINEADIKVTAYSYDRGKIELLARGARKLQSKLAGHLEPITLSGLMVVRGRKYDYAGTAVSESCFFNIKSDLEKIVFASKAVGLFDQLIKLGERDISLYQLLNSYLEILNRKEKLKAGYELFYSLFVLQLLACLGHQPQLYNCVICGRKIAPQGNAFGFLSGGLICPTCLKKCKGRFVMISENCIKLLRLTRTKKLSILANIKVNKVQTREFFNLADEFKKYCC